MATTNLGCGIWSYIRFNRSAHCSVTPPVTRSTSACLGEGSSFIPKRSTSYFGVSKVINSMSQPLQAPELKWRTQGEFNLAQVTELKIFEVFSSV
jgi:hypothetical protein